MWRKTVLLGAIVLSLGCEDRGVEVGFWFEPITFESSRLGAPIAPEELATIESIARSEIGTAFQGLPISVSARRDARYHVKVVQEMPEGGAGRSRAASFAGGGAVSFSFLANGAIWHAAPGEDRAATIGAIGRGIGRTAVHEITHQLLPTTPIHDGRNVRSYEYASAARREQYHGQIEWDLAWPLLQKRFGLPAP
jgi:hypothetical protein